MGSGDYFGEIGILNISGGVSSYVANLLYKTKCMRAIRACVYVCLREEGSEGWWEGGHF